MRPRPRPRPRPRAIERESRGRERGGEGREETRSFFFFCFLLVIEKESKFFFSSLSSLSKNESFVLQSTRRDLLRRSFLLPSPPRNLATLLFRAHSRGTAPSLPASPLLSEKEKEDGEKSRRERLRKRPKASSLPTTTGAQSLSRPSKLTKMEVGGRILRKRRRPRCVSRLWECDRS